MTMATATPQDETRVTHAKLIDSSEGEGRPWNETAREIHNKVRAFSIWPGTSLTLLVGASPSSKKTSTICVKLISTRHRPDLKKKEVATNVVELGPNKGDGLMVICYDGSVLEVLELIQPHKRAMTARAFVNGIQPHSRFFEWVMMEQQPTEASAEQNIDATKPTAAATTTNLN
jgi:methionyl-tRNA formyltransferase